MIESKDSSSAPDAKVAGEPLLKVRGVSKAFPGVQALDDIDLELFPGEVHFLIGENGAGKSTLINILSGSFPPDTGEVVFDGRQRRFASPIDAQRAGIRTIHQEFMLIPNVSVAENITIGDVPRLAGPIVHWKRMYRRASEKLTALGVDIDVRRKTESLKASEKQIVDIARALVGNAKLLIMDEPTSALSSSEIDRLFEIVKELKKQGIAVIYISHRLEELSEIADHVTVLRDGRKVETRRVDDQLDVEDLVEKMVGRRIADQYPHVPRTPGAVTIETSGLTLPGAYDSIDMQARSGEIVGVTGVIGSGMEALAYSLTGLLHAQTGQLLVNGESLEFESPGHAIDRGIGLIPADRREMGVVVDFPVCHNVSLTLLDRLGKAGWIRFSNEQEIAHQYVSQLGIVVPSLFTKTRNLSGGNQQKVVIAKWLARNVDTLVCVEPTRGIDVGTKAEIYRLLDLMAQEGKTLLMFSTDYSEIIGMCDRIYVMRNGSMMDEYRHGDVTRERLIKAVFGTG